jgi:hypothetical protein
MIFIPFVYSRSISVPSCATVPRDHRRTSDLRLRLHVSILIPVKQLTRPSHNWVIQAVRVHHHLLGTFLSCVNIC